MFVRQWKDLLGYPASRWGATIPEQWESICISLRDYRPIERSLQLDKVRKWELVSALQKSIRRGEKLLSLRLVSAMTCMPEEYGYFWRRICVIACEDVGFADDLLTTFVVACATIFPPKSTGHLTYGLWCFLVEQLCDRPNRSRVYCSLSIVETAILQGELPELTEKDLLIVAAITKRAASVEDATSPWTYWLGKNDWRGEGMLKFVGMELPFDIEVSSQPVRHYQVILDLPSYAYDMHTRIGLAVLKKLVRGIDKTDLRDFFKQHPSRNPHKTLGSALFFEEGGLISGELIYEPLISLEQRLFAHQNGLSLQQWWDLRALIRMALIDGLIDRVREEQLRNHYRDQDLQLIAKTGAP